MSKENNSLVIHGVIHGNTIKLEKETGWPDGKKVVVLVSMEEELKSEIEALETLQSIYRMRHIGRSVVNP